MSAEEILSLIERFEGAFDTYHQAIQKNFEDIVQNLSVAWKKMKTEQKAKEKILGVIREQEEELTDLKTKSDELDKKIEELNAKKDELTSDINELKQTELKTTDDMNKPKLTLENLTSKLNSINEKINIKEKESSDLDQRKIDNETKEAELQTSYEKKMEDLEKKLNQLKLDNFFTSFLIEHSDEDIPEVGILSLIMLQGSCKLDDLKKQLDYPPIMSVRTIKQLALAGIINLDESSGKVTMP